MTTLPSHITEHYYSLHQPGTEASAHAVIEGFTNEFTAEEAGRELWLLFSGAITSHHLPYADEPVERQCMLHFYEYAKAMMEAVYSLHPADGNR